MAARRDQPAASAVDENRERMRGWAALALIGLLFTVFVGAFVGPTLRNADQPDAAGALQDLSLLVELGVAPEQARGAGPKPREVG